MDNKEMIEYKESFISRIKSFFRRLFGKKDNKYSYIKQEEKNDIKENIEEKQESFVNEIKVDTKVTFSLQNSKQISNDWSEDEKRFPENQEPVKFVRG